jgi:TPR repeat protein
LFILGIFHSQALACGWWGDGQEDGDDAILVDSNGNPVSDEEPSLDDPAEQTRIGNRFRRGEGSPRAYREAVRWYQKAADQGFAGAQNNLANMFEQGHGVTQDYSKAAQWYLKAAEQENSNAQHSLGRMYLEGRGVPRDFLEAGKWFRKAAEKRHPMAFRDLGTMHWKGLGVSKDTVLAYMWWELGAEYGDEESEKLQNMIAQNMLPDRIHEAEKKAQEWLQGKK